MSQYPEECSKMFGHERRCCRHCLVSYPLVAVVLLLIYGKKLAHFPLAQPL